MDKTVYTYGVFDLLHPGHTILLKRAKSLGSRLVVGVVGDKAVRDLKGRGRPVMPLHDRMRLLEALSCVDTVIEQETYDPKPNLNMIRPDILTKGDDWSFVPGQVEIYHLGGSFVPLPYSKDYSTSRIIEKICLSSATTSSKSACNCKAHL